MAKQKCLKSMKSNFVLVRNTLYLKIPAQMARDSAFPFDDEHKRKKKAVKIFMEENLIYISK